MLLKEMVLDFVMHAFFDNLLQWESFLETINCFKILLNDFVHSIYYEQLMALQY